MSRKSWDSYSVDSLALGSETDPDGQLFISPLGMVDLSSVRVLHRGVDTVRQLYGGTPREFPLLTVQTAYDAGFRQLVDIEGAGRWVVGSGGASGYRYRLQDSERGLLVFLGSRYAELDSEAGHLKIEASPHWLDEYAPAEAQAQLDAVARVFLEYARPSGCAVHLCVDVQGWEPSRDFEDRLTCRAKRRQVWAGVSSVDFDLNRVSAVYGDRETFTFGSAASLQFSAYNKTREAQTDGDEYHWHAVWGRALGDDMEPLWDRSAPVWRLEWRFHHTVLGQFAAGLGGDVSMATYAEVAGHLQGLYEYGLNAYRLDCSRTYIDPMWQVLGRVQFTERLPDLMYKRARPKAGGANMRNFTIALGNIITLFAAQGFKGAQAVEHLRQSGLWPWVLEYTWAAQISISEFTQRLERELALRRLLGKAKVAA